MPARVGARAADRAADRAALDAICRTILPAAFQSTVHGPQSTLDGRRSTVDDPAPAPDLVSLVEHRIATLPARHGDGLRLVVRIVSSRAFVFLLTGRPVRFAALAPDARERMLRRMETSALPALRTMFQALRRVVVSCWYSEPAVQAEIGFPVGVAGLVASGLPAPAAAANPPATKANAAAIATDHTVADAHRAVSRLEPGRRLTADVVVVGSGAGGAVAAAILAEAGRDVLVLEEGRAWPAPERSALERELVPALYAEAGARATDDLSVQILQGRALGGSTFVNWMLMLRTPDDVLHEWAARHGVEGAEPERMRALFEEVERECAASAVQTTDHSRNNRILLNGAARLRVEARTATINARGCVHAGVCGLGCPWSAKQSVDESWLPRALRAGARIATGARARAIERAGPEAGRHGALKRVVVEVTDSSGRTTGVATVEAPVVVVAAGAIETPALLQRSGLGGGGVGRWLRLHPTSAIVALHDEPVQAGAGIPMSVVCAPERADDGYGYWLECPPFLPGLGAVALPGFGERHRRLMTAYTHLATNIVLVRDGADGHSHGSVRSDGHGRPRIRYRLGERERATLARGLTAAARLQLAAGAREVVTLHAHGAPIRDEADLGRIAAWPNGPNQLGVFSAHVMGTCRIGRNPEASGCRPDGQRHGARGVYVMDGSLLPTAPGVNPQETIMALALMLARRLVAGA